MNKNADFPKWGHFFWPILAFSAKEAQYIHQWYPEQDGYI
jgi:hypothetical protein